MSDTPLPFPLRQWMQDRHWGMHHVEWHMTRQWDRLPPAAQAEATARGWRRYSIQEGEAGNGFEFLMMHRAMLQLLREAFPGEVALFAGWATPPTNPADPSDPVPPANPQAFSPDMRAAITRLTASLATFATDDELGRYIETRSRPTPADPFARSPDASTGIHNYLHNRFDDASSSIRMGDPEVNIENAQFWRLHGWIDARWSAYRAERGLSDDDPAFQQALRREREHLTAHVMHGPQLLAAGQVVSAKPLSASLRSPFRETPAARFVRVMKETPQITTLEELREYLQTAIMLEHATLPLYLTAMWSIRGTSTSNRAIARIHRGIIMQEMVHMGLVCNLLKAVGGTVKINSPDAVLQFPDYLPGLNLSDPVDLRPLSTDRIKLFMRVEEPENPIQPTLLSAVPRFPTIGEFYKTIDQGLVTLNPTFGTAGQLQIDVGADPDIVTVISNLAEARRAIKLIQEQGEGTPATQGAAGFGGGLAHYYQFQQIDLQMRYVQQPDGTFKLDPAQPLPFPTPAEIYPMAVVPAGGYPGVPEGDAFDLLYSEMLAKLQGAWDGGDLNLFFESVDLMQQLRGAAVELMQKPLPGGVGNYGPAFRLVNPTPVPPPPGPGAAPLAAQPAGVAAAPVPGYARIQQLLQESVNGASIGAHGNFWQTLTRDQFVARSIFGKRLIAERPDGTFDPDESNLVKALEGRPPFGANLEPPPAGAIFNRMPDGFDPMPQVRIDEIRAWIAAGCPDAPAVEPAWIDATATALLTEQAILTYWREFDRWAMFEVTEEVSAAIGVFFDQAPLWMRFAADAGQEPAWQAALQDAAVRDAIRLLEAKQRETVVTHFGRPVPLGALLNAYRRFGDNSLPNDPLRPDDVRHNMNGRVMWFMWSAFTDACLRLAAETEIPAPFWHGMARALLVGLMNDGLIRGRFTVVGFPATAAGQDALQQMVRDLADDVLPAELTRRFGESGVPVP